MPNSLSQYATTGEARVARKLIRAALAAGYTVSVHDGEEWTVKRSIREADILDALATTDEDRLLMRSPTANDIGEVVGSFWLVYGNDENGEELISDHTDNEACDRLYRAAHGSLTDAL